MYVGYAERCSIRDVLHSCRMYRTIFWKFSAEYSACDFLEKRLKKGEKNGVVVIDDYAHHPTEIKAALAAAKKVQHRTTWCVFQPHTFSRTRTLWDEFVGAFDDADELILTHIYAAREKFDGVTKPENLAEDIKKRGVNAQYIDKFEDIAEFLKKNVKEGDIVFTMGAGDVVNINKLIVE